MDARYELLLSELAKSVNWQTADPDLFVDDASGEYYTYAWFIKEPPVECVTLSENDLTN